MHDPACSDLAEIYQTSSLLVYDGLRWKNVGLVIEVGKQPTNVACTLDGELVFFSSPSAIQDPCSTL